MDKTDTAETQKYVVTKTAPRYVAGHRVKAGKTIELTEAAARSEIIAGHITPKTSRKATGAASSVSDPDAAEQDA